MPVPILILSDAPDSGTGLGRITKDLAQLLSTMPEFRVGTMGRSGFGSRDLPWAQYTFGEQYQWGEELLPKIWSDFSGGDYGVIFTVWDASRLTWFGAKNYLPQCSLKTFIESSRFEKWGYFPIDAYGPNKKLSTLSSETLSGYNRVLAYSKFGKEVLENTIGVSGIDFIPHGIDGEVFQPKDPRIGRRRLSVSNSSILVGCVMTNQARKDWGVWAETARELLRYDSRYMFWAHVDVLERYWSLPALIEDFGLQNNVKITQNLTDEALAEMYSACDVTMLPSLGEGFGYPLAESLACGIPTIHHSYGAGSEILPEILLGDTVAGIVESKAARLDTLHNVYRPLLVPSDWVGHVRLFTDGNYLDAGVKITTPEECRSSVEHLFWPNLAPTWKNWFRSGLV